MNPSAQKKSKVFTLSQLASGLDVSLKGNPDCPIEGICTIQQSKPGHITFLINSHYKKYLSDTTASAVILDAEFAADCPVNAILCKNPHFVYAKIAAYFETIVPSITEGVHPTAVVGDHCEIAESARINANVVIGKYVRIGEGVVIGANTYVGDYVEIDEDTMIDPNVTLYHSVRVGKRTHISSGVVVGSDGFGFAAQNGEWHRIPQLGSVQIGDDVDIGSNTTIDRGAVDDTIISNGVKLDNQILIAHNVILGDNTIIAGCVAIAGSTTIGKNCMIGGGSCFAGHITVCDNTMITGMSSVSKSITEPGIYSSGIVGTVPNKEFRKNNARFYRLGQLMDRVKSLESIIKTMSQTKGE